MALYHFSAKVFSRSSRNTVRAVAYRAGCQLTDPQTGEKFDYRNKDVEHVELLLPKDPPSWALRIQDLMKVDQQKGVQALVDIVEKPEKRINSQVWREFEFALHRELTKEQNMALAREFVQDQICSRGMAAQLNFHFDADEKTKEEKPHCHVLVTTRSFTEDGMGPKERDWNKKELLQELRIQWQDYSNFHLKLHGHDVTIDHRCNKDRGIEMEPQPKRSKGMRELEQRLQKLEGDENQKPITEKAKEFQAVQLRNLYRIVRNPDIVLDIVTKHHTTFMWSDVQKILHRYVDDFPLFQRLELHLQNSKELILLRPEERDAGKAIYTTRSMLQTEKSLIEHAETLSCSKSHGVYERNVVQGIIKANESLKKHGGLSQDQIKAIYHLTDCGQLKCVVGIAGAGKTTALKVCQDIWQESGHKVYGLAPTGKAAQNLEREGIKSSTLHKFLKDFEEGRCQYNPNSVLVLDEAGMVDVERFSGLMEAVTQLGVKLITVGDGAQLQPVEAGPAFRLVTERIGKSELHTVIRQKEEWQKEATLLFGRQETREAVQTYMDRGHVHSVEEKLPSLSTALEANDKEGVVRLYEVSKRTSSLMYREMAEERKGSFPRLREHQDFGSYLYWKNQEKEAANHILKHGNEYKSLLEERGLDPLKMALLCVDKKQDKEIQQKEAQNFLQNTSLESLIGIQRRPGKSVDVRKQAKEELVGSWLTHFKGNPDKSSLMLAFSKRDVSDLNKSARAFLKESGHIDQKDFTYTIKREDEDDFGRKQTTKLDKDFSIGDRIVFTRNNHGLDVQNGSMGIITSLNKQTLQVKLEGPEGKEISFAPNLNPYFDQGWAITIHKSQGTTVDQTYVLASYEMTQNLAYVAMTRHRENAHVFGSQLDFWRPEKLPEILSKSGEKLSAADYLDANSLTKLMQEDDKLITKIFTRLSHELEAMGAVSKKAFWQVADHFLGIRQEQEIRINPDFSEAIREEVRAEKMLQKAPKLLSKKEDVLPQDAMLRPNALDLTRKAFAQRVDPKVVEDALKSNMASFADDIFSSIGESYNAAASSASERRYGKNGHIAVNLKTGAWIDYKDDTLSGGPLHMLTKLKGFSFKEALEFGANWAGLSEKDVPQTGLSQIGLRRTSLSQSSLEQSKIGTDISSIQPDTKEVLEVETKAKIAKAQALWNKGQPIQGTLAERYLRAHRKIEGALPNDLRYLSFFKDTPSKQSFPCLIAGARSPSGDITAVQLTFLDPITAAKANIEVPKRSFGVIKGAAVMLQENGLPEGPLRESSLSNHTLRKPSLYETKTTNVFFIAEGVETAVSLKSAGIQGTIKASLGLSNLKRIIPDTPDTPIVICADHDAPDSPAARSLEKSVSVLQEKGYSVTVIKPDRLGDDFNDVLKKHGPQGVREILEKNLQGHIKTVQAARETLGANVIIAAEIGAKAGTEAELKLTPEAKIEEKSFQYLTQQCEKRLHDLLEQTGTALTPERKVGIPLEAERTATYIMHSHGFNGGMLRESEMAPLSLRVKYELDRIPEIQRELMDEGEENLFRAYKIADRLASIEGRFTYEAMKNGTEPPHYLSYVAKKEFNQHREQLPDLAQELTKRYDLSDTAAQHCAQNMLRYKEIHGVHPSADQTAKMAQISQHLEHKEYTHISHNRDAETSGFLRGQEADVLFRNGLAYDTSRELNHAQTQAKKSLEILQCQMEKERELTTQREFSL